MAHSLLYVFYAPPRPRHWPMRRRERSAHSRSRQSHDLFSTKQVRTSANMRRSRTRLRRSFVPWSWAGRLVDQRPGIRQKRLVIAWCCSANRRSVRGHPNMWLIYILSGSQGLEFDPDTVLANERKATTSKRGSRHDPYRRAAWAAPTHLSLQTCWHADRTSQIKTKVRDESRDVVIQMGAATTDRVRVAT